MSIISIPRRKSDRTEYPSGLPDDARDWIDIFAGGSLLAGGLLLLTGRRRMGLVLSVTGAALTLLGQQETVQAWWEQFPGYVDRVQNMVGRVQTSMDELSATRDSLHQALTGTGK
jgi:hypothetical protein